LFHLRRTIRRNERSIPLSPPPRAPRTTKISRLKFAKLFARRDTKALFHSIGESWPGAGHSGYFAYDRGFVYTDNVGFLTQASGQIAIAVENALAYKEISELKDRLAREKLYLEEEIRSEMNHVRELVNRVFQGRFSLPFGTPADAR